MKVNSTEDCGQNRFRGFWKFNVLGHQFRVGRTNYEFVEKY